MFIKEFKLGSYNIAFFFFTLPVRQPQRGEFDGEELIIYYPPFQNISVVSGVFIHIKKVIKCNRKLGKSIFNRLRYIFNHLSLFKWINKG